MWCPGAQNTEYQMEKTIIFPAIVHMTFLLFRACNRTLKIFRKLAVLQLPVKKTFIPNPALDTRR